MTAQVSVYLCSLVHLLDCPEGDEIPPGTSYGPCSLVELIQTAVSAGVFRKRRSSDGVKFRNWLLGDPSTGWLLPDADKLYAINLLRKCITTKFHIFCKTTVPSTDLCREFSEAAKIFNSQAAQIESRGASTRRHLQLSFGDFVQIFVSRRSEFTAEQLLSRCSEPGSVVSLARVETQFVHSLISAFNTHSSLLEEFSVDEEPPRVKPHLHTKHLSVEPLFPHGVSTVTTLPSTANTSPSTTTRRRSCDESVLKRIEQIVVSEIWKKVAVCLKCAVVRGKTLGDLATKAAEFLAREKDLKAAAKCLQYVAKIENTERELRYWDQGFQNMLALSQKRETGKKCSKSVEIFCEKVLPPLQRAATATSQPLNSQSVAEIDSLTAHSSILTPLTISIHTISNSLMGSLELCLVSSNLPALARYTFSEGPRVYRSLCGVEQDIRHSLPPTGISLLEYSREHFERKQIEVKYTIQQATFNHMCEGLERAAVGYHDHMREKCRQCWESSFPLARHWRAIGKQRGEAGCEWPSQYCEVVVEQLLRPLTEAALSLEAQAQSLFLSLSATIFFLEYRRIILSNKHTYRAPAGRQLLVDLHHLHQWMVAENLGLLPETEQTLSALSVVTEMERGLQSLCRSKTRESDHDCQVVGGPSGSGEAVRGLSSLPVWSEIAWHRSSDWLDCIL